ncbi:MAG: HlyD family secretion protein [Pseudolabrys sp.]
MITLLIAAYVAICVVVFKILRVPASTWTVVSAAFIGLVFVGGTIAVLNYNHPFTTNARLYFRTTPIFSTVKGLVTDVPIQPNEPLRKGDILFKLDPQPFQATVDAKRAALAAAEQHVKELNSAFEEATATTHRAEAARDRARQDYDRVARANVGRGTEGPYSEVEEANKKGIYLENENALKAARAAMETAKLTLDARIDGRNTEVAQAQADLRYAEYDLSQAIVTAPTNGYVTQLALQPGMVSTPMPIRPLMVFIHTDGTVFAAAFPQSVLQRIRVGDAAEMAFQAVPGHVFAGHVKAIINAVAQGQIQPSGQLATPDMNTDPGLVLVTISITSDMSAYQIPAGAVAQTAIYSSHWTELALVRRILLRMRSWLNYLVWG